MESLFVRAEDLLKKRDNIEKESEQKIEQMLSKGSGVPALDK
jgi:hypothetical protein